MTLCSYVYLSVYYYTILLFYFKKQFVLNGVEGPSTNKLPFNIAHHGGFLDDEFFKFFSLFF